MVVPRVQPSEKPNLAADRVAERTANSVLGHLGDPVLLHQEDAV